MVTHIVNNTNQVLNVKVGNHDFFVDCARIRKGSKHTMEVDYSDTYHEYMMGPDRTGKSIVVSSDDCCDYKCITITEIDGRFSVDRVPRTYDRSSSSTEDKAPAFAPVAKKQGHKSSLKSLWKRGT